MEFKVITQDLPTEIFENLEIEYIVRPLLGIPLKWRSKISLVEAPYKFADEQLKGPYAYWFHEHTFEEKQGGVLMGDKVTYAVPFGLVGQLANTIMVKRKLAEIFDYRTAQIKKLFKV